MRNLSLKERKLPRKLNLLRVSWVRPQLKELKFKAPNKKFYNKRSNKLEPRQLF
jgi:hypothetical protein